MQNACRSHKKAGTQIKLHAVPATSRTQMNRCFCVLFPFLLEKIIDYTETLYSTEAIKSNVNCTHHINVMSWRTILQNISIRAVYNQAYRTS